MLLLLLLLLALFTLFGFSVHVLWIITAVMLIFILLSVLAGH